LAVAGDVGLLVAAAGDRAADAWAFFSPVGLCPGPE
jgi:hypothetical protein